MRTYRQVKSMKKGMEILTYLSEQRDTVSGSEIAKALEMPHGTVMSYLATLMDKNWVSQNGGNYEVGQALATMWARKVARLKATERDIRRQINDLEG